MESRGVSAGGRSGSLARLTIGVPHSSAHRGIRRHSSRFASFLLVLRSVVLLWPLLCPCRSHAAEDPVPQASPAELGLVLPQATPRPGGDRRVVFAFNGQEPEVAEVFLEVGDHYVLMMPDGHLVAARQSETTVTDRPFTPLDKKELAQRLTTGRFAGFRTRSTRRYLYVYNTSESFATATSRILETMYPALTTQCRRWKLSVEDPRFPLVVVMFRTQEEFEKYRSVPEGLVAYYNGLSNHVVLFEQSKLTEIAPELAFKQAVSTIAHEGVHQILHNIGVQQRLSSWPVWFSEGLAEYFAPTEVDRRVRWKGVGLVNDLRLYELSEFYKARNGKSTDGDLIRRTVESSTMDSLGYATSWALIHHTARYQRDQFANCLREASEIGPLQSIRPGILFTKYIASDYSQFEADLTSHLQSLPYADPVVNQTHFVLMIQHKDHRETMVTASPANVMKRQREKAKDSVVMAVQAFPNRDAAEVFAKNWEKAHRD